MLPYQYVINRKPTNEMSCFLLFVLSLAHLNLDEPHVKCSKDMSGQWLLY